MERECSNCQKSSYHNSTGQFCDDRFCNGMNSGWVPVGGIKIDNPKPVMYFNQNK